jgi:hypothetical protein
VPTSLLPCRLHTFHGIGRLAASSRHRPTNCSRGHVRCESH